MYQYWYDHAHSNSVRPVNSSMAKPIILMNSKQESLILLNWVSQLIARPKQNYRMQSILKIVLKFLSAFGDLIFEDNLQLQLYLMPNWRFREQKLVKKNNSLSISSTNGAIYALHLNQKLTNTQSTIYICKQNTMHIYKQNTILTT